MCRGRMDWSAPVALTLTDLRPGAPILIIYNDTSNTSLNLWMRPALDCGPALPRCRVYNPG